jgi:hypothetical protein
VGVVKNKQGEMFKSWQINVEGAPILRKHGRQRNTRTDGMCGVDLAPWEAQMEQRCSSVEEIQSMSPERDN